MTAMKPSKSWRLVLRTSGGIDYESHRLRAKAEMSSSRHIERIKDGRSSVTRIALENWLEETGTWVRLTTLWPEPTKPAE